MRTIRTDRARETFLTVLAEACNVSAAARAAGFGRSAAYAWRADDEEFRAAWDEAIETAVDSLEETAWDRARIDKSDRMLEILLKAHRPEKYVEKYRAEITGKDGDPIELKVAQDADAFTRAIAGLAARAATPGGIG